MSCRSISNASARCSKTIRCFPSAPISPLAQVTSPASVTTRTWERGAGLTLACGSAACSAAVSAARTGRTGRNVAITVASATPPGILTIEWRERDDHVIMTGPAEWEWSGTVDPTTGLWFRDDEPRAESAAL